jgi:hypothetical protein
MSIDGLDFESVGRVHDGRGIGIGGEPVKSSGGRIILATRSAYVYTPDMR